MLWQQALAARVNDPDSRQRDRLRTAFEKVRERAQPMAEAIGKDLPDFTVHDITHSDALWEYADLIVGQKNPLNPCEAFVLGCAFLLHDLGMGLAAYPDGLAGLKKLELWKDTVADLLRKMGIEKINNRAIANASPEIEKWALADVLRRLHAERAEKLAFTHWTSPTGDQQFTFIEDSELKDAFGPIIGRISCSHWWQVDQLPREFPTVMGALVGFPQSWTVDPLRLACILRCADYAHIDERRAPAFLRALRKPGNESDNHWKFQAKLYQPRLDGDRLVYTAKSGFTINDAGAWWLCFDTLSAIDSELRRVDSLLADTRRARFEARGVSQAEDPSRLAKLIKTDGWIPVDTRIRVSAVADLVGKLGGKELYGDIVTPPLREMIQNAADAVRARRLLDRRGADWGEIHITIGKDNSGSWLQVGDTGVGMSEAVLSGPLLDFGTTFWGSTLMHDQFPGLAAKGFQPTGRFGIGFFSVFMWGEHVEVITRRFDKGRADTLVLSFAKGLEERPLLRQGRPDEQIQDGGTRVKVWFSDEKTIEKLCQITDDFDDVHNLKFPQICATLAPCLDVTLKVSSDNRQDTVVSSNDWLIVSDETLLKRINPFDRLRFRRRKFPKKKSFPLRILRNSEGHTVGRVAISRSIYERDGIVVVGGLRACSLRGINGILTGSPYIASRDLAVPQVSLPVLKKWANEQRDGLLREGYPDDVLEWSARILAALGIEPVGLPIAKTNSGIVTPERIEELARSIDEALLIDQSIVEAFYPRRGNKFSKVRLKKGVFAVPFRFPSILGTNRWIAEWPPCEDTKGSTDHIVNHRSLDYAVICSLARGWGIPLTDVLKASSFTSNTELFEREIGKLNGKPFIEKVSIIRKQL